MSVTAVSILEVSGLKLLVLPLDIFVQQQPVLCQEMYGLQKLALHLYCLSTRVCAAPEFACLQEPFAAPGHVCLYKSFVLHLDVSA